MKYTSTIPQLPPGEPLKSTERTPRGLSLSSDNVAKEKSRLGLHAWQKELANKIAWAIGTAYGVDYRAKTTQARNVADVLRQWAEWLMDECPSEDAIAEAHEQSLRTLRARTVPR